MIQVKWRPQLADLMQKLMHQMSFHCLLCVPLDCCNLLLDDYDDGDVNGIVGDNIGADRSCLFE